MGSSPLSVPEVGNQREAGVPPSLQEVGKVARLPRCCPHHSDWQVLAEHLSREFPSVSSEQILRDVLDAQAVTTRFALDTQEALDVGELIVRYRLLLSTNQIADVARTDPQNHHVGGGDEESREALAR